MNKVALLTGWPGFERNVALKSVKLFEKYLKREFETFILPEDLEKFIEAWEFLLKFEFNKSFNIFIELLKKYPKAILGSLHWFYV